MTTTHGQYYSSACTRYYTYDSTEYMQRETERLVSLVDMTSVNVFARQTPTRDDHSICHTLLVQEGPTRNMNL